MTTLLEKLQATKKLREMPTKVASAKVASAKVAKISRFGKPKQEPEPESKQEPSVLLKTKIPEIKGPPLTGLGKLIARTKPSEPSEPIKQDKQDKQDKSDYMETGSELNQLKDELAEANKHLADLRDVEQNYTKLLKRLEIAETEVAKIRGLQGEREIS